MSGKKLRYSRQMSQRERGFMKKRLEEEAESARRWKEREAAYLESVAQRAQSVQTATEVRALRLEVWSRRHSFPSALRVLESILKTRRSKETSER